MQRHSLLELSGWYILGVSFRLFYKNSVLQTIITFQ